MIYLKKIISNNIVLYVLWFLLIRKRKGLDVDFFTRNTDIYIDGYPRSGNTFLIHLVRNVWPDLNTVHHLHTVAPIKIALMLKVPVFIIVRDPMEAISSKYLKHFSMRDQKISTTVNDYLLERFIEDYLNYYMFIMSKRNEVSIILFDELIKTPKIVLEKIGKKIGQKNNFSIEYLKDLEKSYRGDTSTMGSSRPNEQKEKYKEILKNYIRESSKFQRILDLYKQVELIS